MLYPKNNTNTPFCAVKENFIYLSINPTKINSIKWKNRN